ANIFVRIAVCKLVCCHIGWPRCQLHIAVNFSFPHLLYCVFAVELEISIQGLHSALAQRRLFCLLLLRVLAAQVCNRRFHFNPKVLRIASNSVSLAVLASRVSLIVLSSMIGCRSRAMGTSKLLTNPMLYEATSGCMLMPRKSAS